MVTYEISSNRRHHLLVDHEDDDTLVIKTTTTSSTRHLDVLATRQLLTKVEIKRYYTLTFLR